MNSTAPVPPDARIVSASPLCRFVPSRARLLALWPALVATTLFLTVMGYEISVIKAHEGGRFVYVLDDSYGHLATARNLMQHGVWTYNHANGFESAVSSLLWPVAIAVCFVCFGIHEYVPLVLNILALIAALFYSGAVLRRTTSSAVLSVLLLCFIVLFTPFAAVAATGMEHSMQIFLSVVFVDLAARLLMDHPGHWVTGRTPWWLCLVGVLLVMTRYEGMFFINAVGLLLLCRKRWKLAVTLGAVSTAPIILFGLYSLSKGWFFLPDSLMIKGNVHLVFTVPGIIQYFSKGYRMLVSEPHMPALIAAVVVALVVTLQRSWNVWTYPALLLVITLIAAAQHLQFASLGWFYRYEAYLIVLGFLGIGVAFGSGGPPTGFRYWLRPAAIPHLAALAAAFLFLAVPFWPRTINAYPFIISASHSIYGQQYQMGRFVRRFYRDKGVIANDVCAISYMGDGIRLVDIAGLCSVEVLRLRFNGGITQEGMRRLSREHGSDIAIVYDDWAQGIFGGALPEWRKAGTWTIPYSTVGGTTVAFYATSQEKLPELLHALQQFAPDLPKDVLQDGLYCGAQSSSPVGVLLPAGGPKDAMHYWTPQTAEFALYPANDQLADSSGATLNLALFPITQNQSVDVYFNGELVATKAFSPAESQTWTSFPVGIQWRRGRNALKLIGHGSPTLRPGDPRPVLFAVLDPRRQISEQKITAQVGVAQPTE